VSTAGVAIFIDYGFHTLSHLKYFAVDSLIEHERRMCLATDTDTSKHSCFTGLALAAFVAINLLFCLCAASLVNYLEPVAAGSGIPEIKCLLNGVEMPRAVRFKALVAKATGVMFSVAGNLPVGKEGPMIHSGAVCAASISQGRSFTFGFDTSFTVFQVRPTPRGSHWHRRGLRLRRLRRAPAHAVHARSRPRRAAAAPRPPVSLPSPHAPSLSSLSPLTLPSQDFRNDKEKRDFIACGAAAGVAAAFGAPVGGVLFTLEEGASFWSPNLTWRAFFCAMMSTFTLFAVASFDRSGTLGNEKQSAMFSFGRFTQFNIDRANYAVYELAIFVAIGICGGLIGATFNGLNRRLAEWRQRNVKTRGRKMLEVAVVSVCVSAVTFLVPLWIGSCSPRPQAGADWSNQEKGLLDELVSFYCGDGEYSETASLFLTESETAIKQLFHFREGDSTVAAFQVRARATERAMTERATERAATAHRRRLHSRGSH
jgi:H+/Cl- antiporter ClcA